ncbi:MAG: hypothetical protein COW29_06275 [Rhodobacterales bacterium CG15_BIG_FIL_POST_REV_8_21_14_020_59_13]|nr:MAG: hypothetical protein COW29_06275 [Rhodobacterales bacterium CG15_BIG_FIL_POST_REV_8_21_14_020_59_13]
MNDALNNMSKTPLGSALATVLRMVGIALGLALMVIAIPLAVTPIPLGVPLFIIGTLMLAGSSPRAHSMITGYLKRHPGFWRRIKHFFGDKDDPEDEKPANST